MPLLTRSYCGIALYLANASCHSASESGGTAPMIGCHSVIDSPEPVSRVAPPMPTITSTSSATSSSQTRTARSDACLRLMEPATDAANCIPYCNSR